jgi:hypothetical protein
MEKLRILVVGGAVVATVGALAGCTSTNTTSAPATVTVTTTADSSGDGSASPSDSSGASDASSSETAGEANARQAAHDYLQTQGFSRSGLIQQLSSSAEGYSVADATYGVDAQNADWNWEAVKVAKDYLQTEPFSRTDLIQQLEFEGFTPAQAVFGVNQTGL